MEWDNRLSFVLAEAGDLGPVWDMMKNPSCSSVVAARMGKKTAGWVLENIAAGCLTVVLEVLGNMKDYTGFEWGRILKIWVAQQIEADLRPVGRCCWASVAQFGSAFVVVVDSGAAGPVDSASVGRDRTDKWDGEMIEQPVVGSVAGDTAVRIAVAVFVVAELALDEEWLLALVFAVVESAGWVAGLGCSFDQTAEIVALKVPGLAKLLAFEPCS
jgi:hypothetical protein